MLTDLIPILREAAPVIFALILIEGLLSVDNILAIASLSSALPEAQRKKAMRLGLAGAYVWRGVALLGASFIVDNPWLKLLGALYLIHLMAMHFGDLAAETDDDPTTQPSAPRSFIGTVVAIQLLDLSLSVDNVVTAIIMSPKLWVIYTGVGLGLLTLWIFATISLKLVEQYPILKHTAFLLVGYVGFLLIAEMSWHFHLKPHEKFYGIALILGLSLWYSKSAAIRRLLEPLCKVSLIPMWLYEKTVSGVWGALSRPFRK